MPVASRRDAKAELMRRLEGDYNRTKGGGSLFRTDLTGVNFWNCKEADHIIDIIPYTSGENDPIEPGGESYVLEIFTHRNVGQQEGMIICMAETFKKPCPICEERRKMIKRGDDDDKIKELAPSRYPRSIYNIVCYDSADEEAKGVQVWHTSNYLLQQYLLVLAKKPVRPGQKNVEPFIAFMDVEEGKSIAFKREGKKENTKYIGVRFEDRDYKIDEKISKAAFCLDELIAWPAYEEVFQEFYGIPYVSDEKIIDNVVDCGKKYEEKEKEEVLSTRGRRHAEHVEEKKEEELSTRTRRHALVEEEKSSSNKCPAGKGFGIDIDELKECDKCSVWKECAKEADAIEKAKKK